ncbi:TPA: 50S ribosomal protein L25 [Clostridium botulinum]|nr:50S ribosomal protein L25 [Clostridium botulinum]
MSSASLTAIVREKSGKKCRKEGFAPGIIYGAEMKESIKVKFEVPSLLRYLNKAGINSRLWLNIGNKKEYVLIKEIQKEPTTGEILNIDMQAVSHDEVIKNSIPVKFEGKEQLEHKGFLLEEFTPYIEVAGKVGILPEIIVVSVGENEPGDNIKVSDIKLDEDIKLYTAPEELLATVSYNGKGTVEETVS